MYAARRFRTTIGGNKIIPEYKINKMIVRKPILKLQRIHPDAAAVYNEMIQEPLPLKYKLHALPEPDTTFATPLGNTSHIPFQIERTHNNNLPVYTDFVNGRQKKITIVRKIFGDIEVKKLQLKRNFKEK
jgi:hypothetical protein